MNKKKFLIFVCILTSLTALPYLLKKNKQPHLTVFGPISMADGIGRQAAELIDTLKDDLTVGFKPTGVFILNGVPERIKTILKDKTPLGKVFIYEDFLVVQGKALDGTIKSLKNDSSIRIAHSMFEASLIPPEWTTVLNNYFDAVLVPDKFLIETYKNSGVTIPIFVLPLGLNLDKFHQAPLKTKKNHPFVFANFSAVCPRKNQLKLVQSFHQAFGNSSAFKLKLNSRRSDPAYSTSIKEEILRLQATNIEFTEMVLEDALYFKLFQEIDCYVSLSLGEGFSIQPREAMALGIPIIVTDNTGQSTICESQLGRKVDSFHPLPAFYPEDNNYYGLSYDCTLEDTILALQDMYDNYAHYLAQGPAAREWVKQISYSQLKPLYLGLISPHKIVLGDVNQVAPGCLFTDSEELCHKFNTLLGTPFEKNL